MYIKYTFTSSVYPQNYIVRKKAKKSDAASSSDNNGDKTNDNSKLIIPSITRDEKVYQPGQCEIKCNYIRTYMYTYNGFINK